MPALASLTPAPITANGDHTFPGVVAGKECMVEIGGTYDNATVALGWLDLSGTYVAYTDAGGDPIAPATSEFHILRAPSSGVIVVRVASVADEEPETSLIVRLKIL